MSKPQTIEEMIDDVFLRGWHKAIGKSDAALSGYKTPMETAQAIEALIQDRERLARIDEHKLVQHQATVNLKSAKAVAGWSELRVKQLQEASGDAELGV